MKGKAGKGSETVGYTNVYIAAAFEHNQHSTFLFRSLFPHNDIAIYSFYLLKWICRKGGKKKKKKRVNTAKLLNNIIHITHSTEWIANEGKSHIRGLQSRLNLFGFAVSPTTMSFRTSEILMSAQPNAKKKVHIQSHSDHSCRMMTICVNVFGKCVCSRKINKIQKNAICSCNHSWITSHAIKTWFEWLLHFE